MKQFYTTIFLLLMMLLVSNSTYASSGPEAQITTSNSTVCLNQTVTLTFDITGGNNNISYTYNYKINNVPQLAVVSPNNSSTVSVNIPTNVIGTFICVLTSVNETTNASNNININTSSNSVTITVINPTINAGSDLVICKGNTINLNATITGNSGLPITYSWTGPNGYTSSQQNPSIPNSTGAMTGNYTVTATIGNCQIHDDVHVEIITIGVIDPSTLNACSPNFDVVAALSLPSNLNLIQSITINWGDSSATQNIPNTNWSIPIIHTYAQGYYQVLITLTTVSGCIITQSYSSFVGSSPQAATLSLFANQATGCIPHQTQFTLGIPTSNSDGTNYSICFGDSTPCINYIHGSPIPSNWVSSGTTSQFTYYTLSHIYNSTSCGNSVNLNGTIYSNVYLPSVVTTNPCTAPQPQAGSLISVGAAPTASFSLNPTNIICTNSSLTLSNTSNFGATINTLTFACTNTAPFYWTISPATSGLWTAVGLGSNNGSNNQAAWSIGSMNPSITFLQPGIYTITLYVKNSCGLDQISHTICVESPLSPQFTINNNSGCSPLSVATTNTTNLANTCPGNPTYQWNVTYSSGYCGNSSNWSFTNGTSATSANPSFNFIGPGTYSITLTSTNSCGSVTSSPQIVTVKQPPTVSINSITDTCQINTPLLITPSAVINSCAATTSTLTYLWSFPGGMPSSSTNSNPGPIAYNGTGLFTISLSVTNECGTTIASNKTFTIHPLPTITGTFSTCVSTTSQLTTSTAGTWSSSPSGIVSISTNGLVTGLAPGSTTITFTDSNNCTKNIPFTVNPSPTATISGDTSVCQNSSAPLITFTGANGTAPYIFTYTLNGGTAQTIQSTTGNTATISVSTTTATSYTYCLVSVQDSSTSQCSRPYTNTCATVTVTSLPSITSQPLATQNICVGGTIAALTVSSTGGTGITTYQWYSNTTNATTGGTAIAGATASTYTPAAFNTAGTYFYYVVVSMNGSGCGSVTSTSAQISVALDPTISAQPLATQTQCQGSPATQLSVTATGGVGTFNYQWYSNTTNTNSGGTLITGATNSTYTPLTTTVTTTYYYCQISQTGLGCGITSATAAVIVVAAPAVSVQPLNNQTVCLNGATTNLSVDYTNGTGTASYQWYSNTTNTNTGGAIITGAINASYTPPSNTIGDVYYYCVITFSSGGCVNVISDTAQVTVTPLPSIISQPLATQSICEGSTIPALTVSSTGGTGNTTYQWYSNTTNSTNGGIPITGATADNYTPLTFVTPGTYYYYVIITMNGSGCGSVTSTTSEVIVSPDPTISTQPLTTQTLCQGSASTPITVVASGGLGAFNYQWYSNTSNNTTTGSPIAGEVNDTYTPPTTTVGTMYYYCEVSQTALGCGVTSATATVTIVASPAVNTQPLTTQTVCLNDTTTTLNVDYINGTGIPSYQWFSNNINNNSGGALILGATSSTYTPTSTTAGTVYYYCEITFSSGGCSLIVSNTAEVIIDQVPIVVNQSLVLCSGDTLNFLPQQGNGNTIPNATLYTWSLNTINPNGAISGSIDQNIPQSTFSQTLTNNTNQIAVATYTVIPTAAICTGNPFTIEVTVYPKPQIIYSDPNQIICNQTNSSIINLTSTIPGNVTINWTATIPSGITGAIANGTDTIPIQNLNNNTNAPLTIDYTAVGTFSYNGNTCSGPPAIYSITVNPTLNATGVLSNYNGYNVSFFGGNDGFVHLTVNGGSGVYAYTWTGPNGFTASTQDINNIPAGTYTVSISDGYCAPLILTFILTQPPELLIQEDIAVHTNLLCFGTSTGILGVQITQGSIAPYTFQIVNSTGVILSTVANSNSLNAVFNGLIAGTYNVNVIDANGGIKTLTGIIVTQPLDILITVATTPITCYGANNASITLTVTGGTGPYQAQWDNLATGLYQNNLSAGSYTITITDANGCIKPITVVIPQAPIFMVNPITTNISCHGAHNGSINLNLVGGIAPVSLTWSDGSTAGLIRNNLGPGTYTATISDGTPCYIVRTFTIIEPQALVVSAITTNALACTNPNSGSINLMVSGGTPPFNYTWSNGATTEDLSNIIADNYMVTVIDANGCTITAQYSITRPNPLTLNVNTNTTANCSTFTVNQNFTAQATGGVPPYNYNWSSGSISGPNNQVMTTTQNGLVILTVTDAIGCTNTYSLNVSTPVLGNPSFSPISYGYINHGIYSIGDPIQFQSVVPGNYTSILWDFGDGTFSSELNPTHIYINPNDYYLVTQTVTYPFGCVYVHHAALNVQKGYLLVVPTAFTPGNRDGVNDTFRPVTKGLKNVRLDIYDTWGSMIYSEQGEVLVGWDGKIKGIASENGNYYAKVSAETFYGTVVNENQTFLLIK